MNEVTEHRVGDASGAASDELLCEITDGVAVLTINRPEVMNAFSDAMRAAMFARLGVLEADPEVRCIMITGHGKAFSAGGDIPNMIRLQEADDSSLIGQRIGMASDVMQRIRHLPKPVVAAVNGPAAGGGMNLALGCDIRVGSTKALFTEAFVKIGLVPDWGGFQALTRLVGTAKAMEWMMTGDRIDAEEAQRLGLLNALYPAETFRDDALAFCRRLARGPAEALAAIKAGVYLGAEGSLADVFAYEKRVQTALFLSQDAREGMRAFVEKRPPKFGGGD
ncbi:MAG: enoyl-CoA hydratase [Pseudomonadota bacterium]